MAQALLDENPKQRIEALKRILQTKDRGALEEIVERLGQEKDPKVRIAMVYTLGVLGDRAHVPLLAYLTQVKEIELRLRSVQALAKIGHPAGFPSLIRCLATDPDERVRRVAFQAVMRVGSDSVLTLLQRMIASRKDWQRESAILVCSQFNSPLVIPLLVEAHEGGTEEDAALALKGLEQLARMGNLLATQAVEKIKSRGRHLEALRAALEAQMKQLWDIDKDSFDFEKSHTGGLQRVEMEVSPISGEVEVPRSPVVPTPVPPVPVGPPGMASTPSREFFYGSVEDFDFHSRPTEKVEALEPDAVRRLQAQADALPRRPDVPKVIRRGDTAYRLLSHLASGGMGDVYRARAEGGHRDVALKLLVQTATDEEARLRFEREVGIHIGLDHPHIVRLIDGGYHEDLGFLVMELVEGSPLDEGVTARPVSIAEFLCLARPMAGALEYIHGRGCIHRDLKPRNVMLTPEGLIKIGDFGLARSLDATLMTRDSHVIGTPAFMPPEVLGGAEWTTAGDMYSLGVIYYELLSGSFPYPRNMSILEYSRHVQAHEPEPMDGRTGTPELEDLVMKMLDRDPGRRPDAAQVLGFLGTIGSGTWRAAGSDAETGPVAPEEAEPGPPRGERPERAGRTARHDRPAIPVSDAPTAPRPGAAEEAAESKKLVRYAPWLLLPLIALPLMWMLFAPEPEPLPLEEAPLHRSTSHTFDRGGTSTPAK